jgi:hypothetical protein
MPEISHDTENYKDHIGELLGELGLSESVFAATSDNEAAVAKAVGELDVNVAARCIDHTLQLCVKEVLKVPQVASTITKIKKLTKRLKKSNKDAAKVHEAQVKFNLPQRSMLSVSVFSLHFCNTRVQIVDTRWYAVYQALKRLQEMHKELNLVLGDHEEFGAALKDREMDVVVALKDVLGPFARAQRIVEGEKYVTSSLVLPVLLGLRQSLESFIGDRDRPLHHAYATILRNALLER